jgi:N-succinyldiaminopimelate aminotransferase
VFSSVELDHIAEVCVGADLLALSDEVYEHLVFEGAHRLLAQRPGMSERTLTVSSAGKTFSFTGWKIGWAVGPAPLVGAVRTAKQFLTYVNGAPFQPAVALGLGLGDEVYLAMATTLRAGRDRLCDGLAAAGFGVTPPDATYFAMADIRPLGFEDGVEMCRVMPERCGVVAVPASAFYPGGHGGEHYVRFAFCKRPEVLDEAVRRLAQLAPR